jgi:asparagine synthase (glutamine-hydrolysing)
MCGFICNYSLNHKTEEIDLIREALNTISHRGPDSLQIVELGSNFVGGAVRLAMTDPSNRSNQPMVSPRDGSILCFNGEIFNHKFLKNELENLGLEFITTSDTEVLLQILETQNLTMLKRIQGMFAFVWYSPKLNTIYSGRDLLGKKPLFYNSFEGNYFFASEIKAIRKLNLNDFKIDDSQIFEYLIFGNLSRERTGLSEISAQLPGSLLILNTEEILIENYWSMESKDVTHMSARDLFLESVDKRSDDHKIAVTLSGGLDSTTIALSLKILDKSFTAFSAIWPSADKEKYNNDGKIAELTAEKLGVEWIGVEMPRGEDIPKIFETVINALDEPFCNPTAISHFKLYEKIKEENYRLVLNGDGSDEIFAGYNRYKVDLNLNKNLINLSNVPAINALFSYVIMHLHSMKGKSIVSGLMASSNQLRASSWHWIFTPKEIEKYFKKGKEYDFPNFSIKIDPRIKHASPEHARLLRDMDWDRNIWLVDHSNKLVDRMSMAHSIEVRNPFEDENVISKMLSIEPKLLVGTTNKPYLLKMFPELQELIDVNQIKSGFQSPIGYWLRSNREYFSNLVIELSTLLEMNKDALNKLVRIGFDGSHVQRMQIWSLASLAQWVKNSR